MEYPKFKVCCRCFTFNQSKYITDTMNGFTMQQTDFPFVCTIVDDASSDGEQEVISKYVEENFDFSEGSVAYHKETDYAHITYAQHKTNKNCYFAVLYLKENHYSQKKSKMEYLKEWRDNVEYEALCEGDDYWVVYDKLQKQFDIMNQDSEISLVHTGFFCVDESGMKIDRPEYEKYMRISENGYRFFPLLKKGNHIMTLTVMVRRNIYDSSFYQDCSIKIDYSLFLTASVMGKIAYIKERTSCYRNNPNSMINTIHYRVNKWLNITRYEFIKMFLDGKIENKYIDRPFATRLFCIRALCRYDNKYYIPILKSYPQYIAPFIVIYSMRFIRKLTKLPCVL